MSVDKWQMHGWRGPGTDSPYLDHRRQVRAAKKTRRRKMICEIDHSGDFAVICRGELGEGVILLRPKSRTDMFIMEHSPSDVTYEAFRDKGQQEKQEKRL